MEKLTAKQYLNWAKDNLKQRRPIPIAHELFNCRHFTHPVRKNSGQRRQ